MTATALNPALELDRRSSRQRRVGGGLSDELLVAVATADDLRSGLTHAVRILRREASAERVEWWEPADDGRSHCLAAAEGRDRGERVAFPIGVGGSVVVAGAASTWWVRIALADVEPVVRRRGSEERFASMATQVLRRSEALDDFAALVAHELKTAELPAELPLPPVALRIVLRNLIANAVAAGATHVRLSASSSADSWIVAVADNGAGLAAADTGRYAAGSRLGFGLCRRMIERLGGSLELQPGLGGGARATLTLARRCPR